MQLNGLQRKRPANLSLNLSAQAWQALAQIGQQLQSLASAQMGEGDFVPSPRAPTVCELVNKFLLAKARAGRSDRYLRALRNSLAKFAKGRMNTDAGRVTVQEIEHWLQKSHWAARTQKGYLGDVRTLFNFGLRRSLVSHNPAEGVELPVVMSGAISIHTPAEVKTVLEFARAYNPDICRALAVRYFAGLRSAEVECIEESQIRLCLPAPSAGNSDGGSQPEGCGYIEVTAANAKTRRRRLVTIQPCLASWLALGGCLPVIGCQSNVWRDFTAALKRRSGVSWHHNVTRHSFVSYHLAAFQSAAKTALEAGHSEQMLFAHYRELVTPTAAMEFWAITPNG